LIRYPGSMPVTLSPGCNTAACVPGPSTDKIATFVASGCFVVN
jgi:hypothetical protein